MEQWTGSVRYDTGTVLGVCSSSPHVMSYVSGNIACGWLEPSSPCVIAVRAVSVLSAVDQARSWWARPQGRAQQLTVQLLLLHVDRS